MRQDPVQYGALEVRSDHTKPIQKSRFRKHTQVHAAVTDACHGRWFLAVP
jgi:hypothetical protein